MELNFVPGSKKQQQSININKDVLENLLNLLDFIMYIKMYLCLLLLYKATIKYLPASR